ncbi:hypothetical protein C7U60_10090 [Mesorhizobium plurifarium]|uniref:hypothetical protein n=1 Tax=Sinorhizobium arboris TaxID=76745 RepID=UPI000400F4FD|nr:hypothetical protein [Sinorhizobium arboris]PST24025.1 hypothetical protein C7U60_10090 [Mesorhizobium plurifarium]
MAVKHESIPSRAGLAPDTEPDDHVADAGDAGSGAPYLGEADRARPDPPQPQPRNYGSGGGRAATEPATAETGIEADDATGGEYWNRVLGDNTSAGTVRFLAAVGLFVVIAAVLFWLVG